MILVDKDTRVLVQGITGRQGRFHTRRMLDYGTKVLCGTTPKKGGQEVCGLPVYDTVSEVVAEHDIDASIVFVPARFCRSAVEEALDAKIGLVTVITEHVPVWDAMYLCLKAEAIGARVVGPNTPGIVSVSECELGIMPGEYFKKGPVGVVSRSGTLTYEVVDCLSRNDIGQSTCVGIGGDRVRGLGFVRVLKMFEQDKGTRAVVLIGEIGGREEEEAAKFLRSYPKPCVAYVSGRSAPKGKRMGHAGAIIEGDVGTAQGKVKALEAAGIFVARRPSGIAKKLEELL